MSVIIVCGKNIGKQGRRRSFVKDLLFDRLNFMMLLQKWMRVLSHAFLKHYLTGRLGVWVSWRVDQRTLNKNNKKWKRVQDSFLVIVWLAHCVMWLSFRWLRKSISGWKDDWYSGRTVMYFVMRIVWRCYECGFVKMKLAWCIGATQQYNWCELR